MLSMYRVDNDYCVCSQHVGLECFPSSSVVEYLSSTGRAGLCVRV